MQHCINLQERFGRRYRIVIEEGASGRRPDPWYMRLLCRYGHVFPHGGDMLAASVDGHPNVARQLRRLRCCRVWQDGDFGELTVVFDVADFAQVAKIMRPRRRRQVSEAQRQQLAAMGFQRSPQAHVDVQPQPRESTRSPSGDSKVVLQQRALFGV